MTRGVARKYHCAYCGKQFVAYRTDAIYCSRNCTCRARNSVPRTKQCRQCGQSFTFKTRAICCSDECYKEWIRLRDRRRAAQRKRELGQTETLWHRECIVCGMPFTTTKHTKVYCSTECQHNRARRKEPLTLTCNNCETSFTSIRDKAYCSNACRNEAAQFAKYGVTKKWYTETLAAQGGTCAYPRCNRTKDDDGRRLAVDHDHVTGEARGILCTQHNTPVDNLEYHLWVVSYLKAWRKRPLKPIKLNRAAA